MAQQHFPESNCYGINNFIGSIFSTVLTSRNDFQQNKEKCNTDSNI